MGSVSSWYDLLPGRLSERVWRVAAYPFLGIWIAEERPAFGPAFGGIHLIHAAVGSLEAVLVDWVIDRARRPAVVQQLATRAACARREPGFLVAWALEHRSRARLVYSPCSRFLDRDAVDVVLSALRPSGYGNGPVVASSANPGKGEARCLVMSLNPVRTN